MIAYYIKELNTAIQYNYQLSTTLEQTKKEGEELLFGYLTVKLCLFCRSGHILSSVHAMFYSYCIFTNTRLSIFNTWDIPTKVIADIRYRMSCKGFIIHGHKVQEREYR